MRFTLGAILIPALMVLATSPLFAQPSNFETPVFYPTGTNPHNVSVGDVTGNGLLDMATADRGGLSSTIFHNSTGNAGTFTVQSTQSFPLSPEGILILDLTNNRRGDLIAGDFNNEAGTNGLEVRLNANGLGTSWSDIVSYPSSTRPTFIGGADLTGNGFNDVVKVGENGLSVYRNNGSGTLTWTHVQGGFSSSGFGIGDVDGDGDLDLVVVESGPVSQVRIYLNNGGAQGGTQGTFPSTPSSVISLEPGSNPRGLAVGDLNGNGNLDIVVANSTVDHQTMVIFSGDGAGGFTLEDTIDIGQTSSNVVLADLNGNGNLDVVIGGLQGTMRYLYGNGDYTFGDPLTFDSPEVLLGGTVGVAVADVSDNGYPDIIFTSWEHSRVYVVQNNGPNPWQNGQDAAFVVGNPTFESGSSATTSNTFGATHSVAIDRKNRKMYVGETFAHRVLRFNYPITSDQPEAELVFGQPDFTSNTANNGGLGASSIHLPHGLTVDADGTLYVSDHGNNRVLIFENAHAITTNQPSANRVLGQTDFSSDGASLTASGLSGPTALHVDREGNLWIADRTHNRVLRHRNIAESDSGAAADLVLGQPNFTSSGMGLGSASFNTPSDIETIGDSVFISDGGNRRVLRFDDVENLESGMEASIVLGQDDMTSNAAGPPSASRFTDYVPALTSDLAGRLYVADLNRVLIFDNAASLESGDAATYVLGQPDFSTNTANHSRSGFSGANALVVDSQGRTLLTGEFNNNGRVLVHQAASTLVADPEALPFDEGVTYFATGPFAASRIVAGDINKNGFQDIVIPEIVSGESGIGIWQNDGTGSFSRVFSRKFAGGNMHLVDLNGDGNLEIVGAGGGTDIWSMQVLFSSNAEGTAWEPVQEYETPVRPDSVAVGDMTGNGHIDVVVGTIGVNNRGTFRIFENDGTGIFTVGADVEIGQARTINVIDADGDGDLDVVIVTWGGELKVHLNQGGLQGGVEGEFLTVPDFVYQTTNITTNSTVADLNGNGMSSFIHGTADAKLRIWDPVVGTGEFRIVRDIQLPNNAASVDVADLNQNGMMDLLVGGNSGYNQIFYGRGDYTFVRGPRFSGTPTAGAPINVSTFKAVDIDNNGWLEVLMGDVHSSRLNVYRQILPTIPEVIIDDLPEITNAVIHPGIAINFSELVTGLELTDFVTNGITLSNLSGADDAYTVDVELTGEDGEKSFYLPEGAVVGAAGLGSLESNIVSTTLDTNPPSVTISSLPEFTNQTSHTGISITFSEDVTGLELTDFELIGGVSLSNLEGSGAEYTVDVTLTGDDGAKSFSLVAGAATDAAGNDSLASNVVSTILDTTPPTVTIAALPAVTNATDHPGIAITFSESVTGLELTDFTTDGISLSNLAGSGADYTVDVTLTGEDGEKSFSLAVGAATDPAGNESLASNTVTTTLDRNVPTVTIAALPAFTNQVSHPGIAITFSKDVTGLTLGDFSTSGISLSNLSGAGSSYTVDVELTGEDGTKSFSLTAGSAADEAGNASLASNVVSTVLDTTPPTVSIAAIPETTNETSFPSLAITFSENVSGLELSDFSTNGISVSNLQGTGSSYTVDLTFTGEDGSKSLFLTASAATDAAGNTSLASNVVSTVLDTTPPTVTIAALPVVTNATDHPGIAITFSEPVTGLELSDFSTDGISLSNLAGSGADYTVDVTLTGEDGEKSFSLAAGAASDTAGNLSLASNVVTTTLDTAAPSVVLAGLPTLTNQTSFPGITITFDEDVTGLSVEDFDTDGIELANLQGSGSSYTVDVTLTGEDGSKAMFLPQGAAQNGVGNFNAESNTIAVTLDRVAPTVTIADLPTITNETDLGTIAVTFSKSVTGLELGDFTTNGVSLSGLSGSGTDYTIDVTLTGEDGAKSFSLAAGATTDAAGNVSLASNVVSTVLDTTP
ncbi:MAG: VCBS repeat-containing protein, partial [Candidatus Sumerlaeia bacterium]|nr:VCBS repeat-containing protein [Candidatus Sumerlaeia bacterium]